MTQDLIGRIDWHVEKDRYDNKVSLVRLPGRAPFRRCII